VELANNNNLRDISPLAALTELEYLYLAGCYNIESMEFINEAGNFKLLCVPSKRVIVAKYNEYMRSISPGQDIRRSR
jgi:hypothetical protein